MNNAKCYELTSPCHTYFFKIIKVFVMACKLFHWCFPSGQIKKSSPTRLPPPVASQSGVTGWATGRGEAQVTTASAVSGLRSISIRYPNKITEQRPSQGFWTLLWPGQWDAAEALFPLISAQTIWADGGVGAGRNGKPPSTEWGLARGPVARWGREITVKCGWANSWQEQELMAGQGQEKETHSNTTTHPHEACVQQQNRVKGRWGMLMWPPTTQVGSEISRRQDKKTFGSAPSLC